MTTAHDRARRGSRDRARGQAIAEFSLILPVMLVLLLMAVDFGRLFYTYIAAHNAAREATYLAGMQAADLDYDEDAFESSVVAAAIIEGTAQSQAGEGTVDVSEPVCFSPTTTTVIDCNTAAYFAGGIGNQVSVTVSRSFSFLTPFIDDLLGGELVMSATATGPVLNPRDATIYADPGTSPTPSPSPSPSPTPSPSPSPTPTPEPGATPAPTPSPTPTPTPSPAPMCVVPDYYHTYWNDPDAMHIWTDMAGFTGTLTDDTDGHKIQTQSIAAGRTVLCSSSMTVSNN